MVYYTDCVPYGLAKYINEQIGERFPNDFFISEYQNDNGMKIPAPSYAEIISWLMEIGIYIFIRGNMAIIWDNKELKEIETIFGNSWCDAANIAIGKSINILKHK